MIIDAAQLKRRYVKRIAGVRDGRVYIGPETLALDITYACNLNCRYCWFHSPGNSRYSKKAHFLPWERFLEIIRDCVELNVDQINFVGVGEPSLHPKFQDMMRHLEAQPLYVKLNTNATFPVDYCKNVAQADYVNINLGAVNRQQYRDLHGRDHFDHVVNNIKHLVSLRDATKPQLRIVISYILNTINIDQKQKMQELASQLGVREIDFIRMDVHDYNQDITLPEASGKNKGDKHPSSCLNAWFYLVAMPDGNLSTCYRVFQMHGGKIDRRSLKQFWLSKHMMNKRLLGKHGYFQKKFKACEDCVFYDKNIQRLQDAAVGHSNRST